MHRGFLAILGFATASALVVSVAFNPAFAGEKKKPPTVSHAKAAQICKARGLERKAFRNCVTREMMR